MKTLELELQLQEVDFGQENTNEKELETYLYWLRNAYSWQQTLVTDTKKKTSEESREFLDELDELKTEYYH